ncbi:MAG: undecaprenyl-diphosphate phosphatase [Candidatus Shapirobacteria bacterium]
MTLIQSIILSIVQGISEFLPISSSGHLNLFQYLFNLQPSLTLDIFLNTATFVSVLFFFRKQLNYFFKNLKYIIVASIPAALVGIFLKDQVESIFADINLLPSFFLITAALVFSTKYLNGKSQKLDYKKALVIGFFQAIAILPAISRSGATIFAALLLGLAPIEAFKFSFCLFIPASLGALLLSAKDLKGANFFEPNYLIAFVVTTIVGIIALNILQKVLIGKKLWIFGFYTLIIAIVTFILLTFTGSAV